ncbi:hypothetical protein ACO2I3_06505 [Leptospira interrogans]
MKGVWTLALAGAGFTVWATIFLALYGAQAVGCRLEWYQIDLISALSVQRAVQIGLYIAALAMMILLYRWIRDQARVEASNPTREFLKNVAAQGGLAALGAVVFCFAGVLWLTAC